MASKNARSASTRGRPTKMGDGVTKRIRDALIVGATYEAAAQYAGINYSTFRAWMIQGEQDAAQGLDTEFSHFFQTVQRANADAQVYFATDIKRAAGKDWRAAAWMLEHRFKKDYGASVEHRGAEDAPLVFNYEQIASLLSARRPSGDHSESESD